MGPGTLRSRTPPCPRPWVQGVYLLVFTAVPTSSFPIPPLPQGLFDFLYDRHSCRPFPTLVSTLKWAFEVKVGWGPWFQVKRLTTPVSFLCVSVGGDRVIGPVETEGWEWGRDNVLPVTAPVFCGSLFA